MATVTEAEKQEYLRLKALKAWGPRFFELDRRLAAEATVKWRQQDVFGHTFDGLQ